VLHKFLHRSGSIASSSPDASENAHHALSRVSIENFDCGTWSGKLAAALCNKDSLMICPHELPAERKGAKTWLLFQIGVLCVWLFKTVLYKM
jgi:hypothetical protein